MISLYIHVPLCISKCRYCGFYSTAYSPDIADEFISGLRQEAALYRDDFSRRSFSTIYLGGGTPTTLSPNQLGVLTGIVRDHFLMDDGIEFTVEANPKTVTNEKLSCLIENGVNRLSLGIQSFSDEILETLGRLHTGRQAADAFRLARTAGFANIGVDLIYGIPGQTVDNWEETLRAAISLGPDHVSVYSLSFDEGSQFKKEADAGGTVLPEEEIAADMYGIAVQKLYDAGYGRYEISNFALPGCECRHNMNYWNRGEYLGLGPGAWSFISAKRRANIADIVKYSQTLSSGRMAADFEEILDKETASRETVLLTLRTMKGVDLLRFGREFGEDRLNRLKQHAVLLREAGLIRMTAARMELTDRGIMLSNEALTRLCE